MHLTQDLELFPEYTVTQLLFKDVKNATELRKMAVNGEIKGALINPSMVVDAFQILVAANKAVHLHKNGKMKTRSLYSEIIFNLSPTNNSIVWQISEAFKRFGISDSDTAVHIVLVHNKDETLDIDDIVSKVDGQQVAVDRVSDFTDVAKIKKLYKVAPLEEKCGSLSDAVVCRMANKDVA
ncbi:EKC/KEOPS complex subunit TPRKB isoform X1 [Carassius auratus]|uniref:EKC/KEOPS complex subunit TPRKB n=1 Tax=Carassius auratus TaxID=7957 RepID=A0A6P6LC06_CARAU|nr:EKC/KEOPS complex subunit TPRKB isoform X1 [Carassius auratus]